MKVLKVAAIVVGAVALVAVTGGVALGGLSVAASFSATAALASSAIGLGGLAAGATIVGGVLALAAVADLAMLANVVMPKPSQGGSQTKWKADPYAGLPYVIGRTLVAGNIVYRRGSGGSNDYEQFVTVLGIGPIKSIDTSFLNKTTVIYAAGGAANGTYNGQVWQKTQLGACPEPAALSPGAGAAPGWTAQHKLSGLAATMLTFRYDTKSKVQLTSEPTPAWIVEGALVYDPRLDDTYPGGAGPCRAFDETTYVWSEDPHLHALTWAMGRFQNGVRVAGIGNGAFAARAKITGIDVGPFVEGANLNDVRGWKLGGQVTTRPDAPWNSLKAMLQAGGATPVLIGGRISCVNRMPRVSLATITRSDIVGECTLAGTQPRRTRINGIIPQYRSEAHDWEMVSASEVSVPSYIALDGDERTKEIAYPLVQDVHQVAQLAAYDICDAREASPGSVPLKPWWLNYKVGDCVTFQPEDDLSIKVQITGRSIEAQTGVVTYTVRGETDGKHAFALGQTGTAPPIASLVYDVSVPAPAPADWTLVAGTDPLPTLHLTGGVGNPSAEAVIFAYRAVGAADWIAAGAEPATTTDKVIAVPPGDQYEAAVSYRVRGVTGDPLVLAPVTSGSISVNRAAYRIVSQTVDYPVTTDATSATIAAFDAVLDDGRMMSFPAGSVTGLDASSAYVVFWNLATASYFAAAAPATAQVASLANVLIRAVSTSAPDGSYPASPPPPGGDGGGGGVSPGNNIP